MFDRVVVCFMVGFGVSASAGIADEVVVVPKSEEDLSADIIEELEVITLHASCSPVSGSLWNKVEPDEETLELLRMQRSPSVAKRVAAASELYDSGIESGAGVDAVRAWLDREDEPWVRRYLVLTLADLDDETIMLDLLAIDDQEIRSIVAKEIVEYMEVGIGLESAMIEAYQVDDPWWVRAPFLSAFSDGIRDDSLYILHEALEDPVRDVRGAAVIALEERGDPRSLDDLMDVLEDPSLIGEDSPVAGVAALSDASVIPWIEDAAASESPIVREEAATALGRLCARGSEESLRRLLQDRSYGVAQSAAGALKILGFDEDYSATLGGDRLSGTAILSPENRVVAPAQGNEAEAWEVAPGDRNGGTRHAIGAGAIVQVVSGAHYLDETWLEVEIETAGLDTAWIRERDLLRLTPEEALEAVNGVAPRR